MYQDAKQVRDNKIEPAWEARKIIKDKAWEEFGLVVDPAERAYEIIVWPAIDEYEKEIARIDAMPIEDEIIVDGRTYKLID